MVFVGPCLLNVFCVFMCVYVCVRAPVCGCTHKKEVRGVGDKGQCWETSSVTLHLIFLRQVFSLNLKLANSARLAGQQAPHIYLSPPLWAGIPGTHRSASFSRGCWESALGSSRTAGLSIWTISPGLFPICLPQLSRTTENWIRPHFILCHHLP